MDPQPEPDKSSPLDFATTEEIIDELRKRHSSALVILYSDLTPTNSGTTVYYSGGIQLSIGLASYAHHYLLKSLDKRISTGIDEEEEL